MSSTTLKTIAPVDLVAERAALGQDLNDAIQSVLDSGQFILGPEVKRFEEDFAKRCGAPHARAVASGTDALVLGLLAVGVKPGDHVVTSPFTFFASAGAIAWMGAIPRLADVDLDTGLLNPEAAAAAVDEKTSCILPVHLYGQLADMRALRAIADDKRVALLEDGAQAAGAMRAGYQPGELGDACTFSFYPSKNLGACGEGGLVVSRSEAVAERMQGLRDHGSPGKYQHQYVGCNSRMHGFQGAALNVKHAYLDQWNARRREIAARYDAAFAKTPGVATLKCFENSQHAYHQYTLRIADAGRDALQAGLKQRAIIAAVHYPIPVHLQEAAKPWGYGPGDFPHAEQLCREVLCLPVHPFLSDDDVQRVIDGVQELAGN
jgi:dTDP-4-amino-4,6-dideoxygalactose transaminase